MQKKYILFDLDGTLTNPKEGITKSVQYSLKHFGITVDNLDDLLPYIGPPLRDSYKQYHGFDEEKANLAVEIYREYFAETGIFENTIYEGIPDLLKTLKNDGKTLILATSKPIVFAEIILKHFNIAQYFSFVAGSELDGRRSLKKEVIEYALQKCNVNSLEDTIMVGDKKHDIIGANAVGIDSVGVLYGYGDEQELSEVGAKHIASDVTQLLDILNKR